MNYDKFKDQLGSWAELLRPFIVSEQCDRIYQKLKTDSLKGVVICPDSKNTFRAFRECPWEALKVVIVGQDPYPWVKEEVKVADGLAFSCSNTQKAQPSLEAFYDAIEAELYSGLNLHLERAPDLTDLANQGVLLLNATLTVRHNMVGSHKYLWKSFIEYVLNIISIGKKNIIFLLLGDLAQEYRGCIGEGHLVFEAEHPARCTYEHRKWKSNHIFSLTQQALTALHKPPIQWMYEEAPF